MSTSPQRNSTLDAVKGFAIFLVVWGHCIQYMYPYPSSFFDDLLFAAIYSFHMPLFMAVSGYLFGSSVHRYSASMLLGKRAQALLIPAVVWSVIAYIEPHLSHLLRHRPVTVQLTNLLWFLTSLMVCTVVALGCEKLANGHPIAYLVTILLALAIPTDRFDLIYHKFVLPYFVAGLFAFRYSATIPRWAYRLACPLSFVLWGVMLAHWTADYYIYTTGMSLNVADPAHKLWIISYRYLIGFAGVCWAVSALRYWQRYGNVAPLIALGNFTLGIYAITAFFNPRLHRIPLPSFRLLPLWWAEMALFAFLQCVACIYAIKAIRHSRFLSILLLGESSKRGAIEASVVFASWNI